MALAMPDVLPVVHRQHLDRARAPNSRGRAMIAEAVLARLDRVRRVGDGRWIAQCPAHESKSKSSLAIREVDDGRILVHDFGGCRVAEVLAAIGLRLDDLFPEKIAGDFVKRERRPWTINQGLEVLDYEVGLVAIAALTIGNGGALKPDDCERVLVAHQRIQYIIEALRG
jgi:hypothetical protein